MTSSAHVWDSTSLSMSSAKVRSSSELLEESRGVILFSDELINLWAECKILLLGVLLSPPLSRENSSISYNLGLFESNYSASFAFFMLFEKIWELYSHIMSVRLSVCPSIGSDLVLAIIPEPLEIISLLLAHIYIISRLYVTYYFKDSFYILAPNGAGRHIASVSSCPVSSLVIRIY